MGQETNDVFLGVRICTHFLLSVGVVADEAYTIYQQIYPYCPFSSPNQARTLKLSTPNESPSTMDRFSL
jgi:hypothetical protein